MLTTSAASKNSSDTASLFSNLQEEICLISSTAEGNLGTALFGAVVRHSLLSNVEEHPTPIIQVRFELLWEHFSHAAIVGQLRQTLQCIKKYPLLGSGNGKVYFTEVDDRRTDGRRVGTLLDRFNVLGRLC